tara:strand:+ start:249 stop:473 length:225 start_codon:yes stop_codon:yes gene_type:complete
LEPWQIGPVADVVKLKEGVVVGFTVMLMLLDVPVEALTQLSLEVITQVTVFPLDKLEELNVALLLPAFTPFTFH